MRLGSSHNRISAAYLFQQPALLDDVCYGLHLNALGFVDILEGVQVAGLLVLHDAHLRRQRRETWGKRGRQTHLAERALSNTPKKDEMKQVNLSIKVYGLRASN